MTEIVILVYIYIYFSMTALIQPIILAVILKTALAEWVVVIGVFLSNSGVLRNRVRNGDIKI